MVHVSHPESKNHTDKINDYNERRMFVRLPTELKALYYLNEDKEGLKKCTVFDIHHKGLGIRFNDNEDIPLYSVMHLGLISRWQLTPVSVTGMLKWTREAQNELAGGIEFLELLDSITLLKLF